MATAKTDEEFLRRRWAAAGVDAPVGWWGVGAGSTAPTPAEARKWISDGEAAQASGQADGGDALRLLCLCFCGLGGDSRAGGAGLPNGFAAKPAPLASLSHVPGVTC
jgi:hypothetical protein